jgi:hypothetical protein
MNSKRFGFPLSQFIVSLEIWAECLSRVILTRQSFGRPDETAAYYQEAMDMATRPEIPPRDRPRQARACLAAPYALPG